MKLTKEELQQILKEVERVEGKAWRWLDIPTIIRKDNTAVLVEIIRENKEELKRLGGLGCGDW